MVCPLQKSPGALSVTTKPAGLAGLTSTILAEPNTGGSVANAAKVPSPTGENASPSSDPPREKNTGAPLPMIQKGHVLFNYLAIHYDLAEPIGSLTVSDVLKWCKLLEGTHYAE
jgi:hypothetical protein